METIQNVSDMMRRATCIPLKTQWLQSNEEDEFFLFILHQYTCQVNASIDLLHHSAVYYSHGCLLSLALVSFFLFVFVCLFVCLFFFFFPVFQIVVYIYIWGPA